MSTATVTLRITGDSRGLQVEIAQARRLFGSFEASARSAGAGTTQAFSAAKRGIASISSQLRTLQNLATVWATLSGVRVLARDFIATADAVTGLRSRLRLVTDSVVEYESAWTAVEDIAARSRGSLESTSALFTRLSQASDSLGLSQQRVANITEAVSAAVTLSGGSAQSAAAGVQQLAQAFSSGTLSGDEFRSVLENSPRLVTALTDALGVNVGQLRKLAEQQLLTSDLVAEAIESQLGVMRRELTSMPETVGQAIQQVNNAWMLYVGAVNQANAATDGLGRALHGVSGVLRDAADEAEHGGGMLSGLGDVVTIVAKSLVVAKNVLEQLVAVVASVVDYLVAAGEVLIGLATNIGYAIEASALAMQGNLTGAKQAFDLAGTALADAWDSASGRITRANGGLSISFDQNFSDISASFARLNGEATTEAEAAERVIERVRGALGVLASSNDPAAQNLVNTIRNATGGFIDWGNAAEGAEKQIEALRARVQALLAGGDPISALSSGIAGIEGKFANFGKTAAQVARAQLDAAKSSEAWNKLLPEQRASLEAAAESAIAHAAAMERTVDPTKKLRAAGDAAIALARALSEQRAELSPTDAAIEAYVQRVTDAHIQAVEWTQAGVDAASVQAYLRGEIELATRAMEASTQATADNADAMSRLTALRAGLSGDVAELRQQLAGASQAQIAFNRTQREAAALLASAGGEMNTDALEEYTQSMLEATEKLGLQTLMDGDAGVLSIVSAIDQMRTGIEALVDPMNEAFDPKRAEQFSKVIDGLNAQLAVKTLGSYKALLGAVQTFTKEGSSSFKAIEQGMAALSIVQDIIALKAAVTAVLTQGEGEPYSAWARMAAMAAAVAPFLASIGQTLASFGGGGFTDTAARRQEAQGTGSVLGDSEADSESIANGVEITADATSELVGINRGMLSALLALQDGISGAVTMLARGAGNADFSGLGLAGDTDFNGLFDFGHLPTEIADPFGWLSGDSDVTDQGILIVGGLITDMVNSIMVGAYQEVQTSSWAFGSTSTSEGVVDVSEEFGTQFQLVIGSIVDTVREGALAIGLLPEEVEAALAAYRVEEIRISLMDLSAEEQEAEMVAVLGELFDGLAGTVVPFIAQFQEIGEGLGETLVRVATSVQVVQEATRYLGLAINETDPERFAQISVELIDLAGGIEEFIGGMQAFANAFAPESERFLSASSALVDAFAQVGLSVPATRDAMWALMQSLDATTEAGREQIATLLRLADVSDQYYSILEDQLTEARDLLASMGLLTDGMSNFRRELIEIRQSGAEAEEAANLIAIAQGRQGASAVQLARISQWTAAQMATAFRRLQQETQDLIAQLYGGLPGTLDGINARISELEGTLGSGIGAVAEAGENLFESWRASIQSLNEYLDSMLLGPLSALSPEEQMAVAQQQLIAAQQAAMAGDIDALNSLPQLAEQYLQIAQANLGSGEDYNTQFDWVRELLAAVREMENPFSPATQQTVELVPSAELAALYAERDALMAQQDLEQRAVLAQQLAQNLADWALLLQAPVLEFIQLQGVSLAQLATDLGVNFDNLNAGSVQALGGLAATLGISLTELTGALGLSLTDLSGGLAELTAQVGIDLANLTAESTQTLALLGTTLGADLSELATSLGIELGALTDAQSLINDAFQAELATLPSEQADALAPLLQAVEDAATEADANAAIAALEAAVNGLAPDIRNQLAPYLAGVFPADALEDLDYLADLRAIAAEQLDVLGLIRDNVRAANVGAGVPSYAVGTGYVPATGLALLHQGESVWPAPITDFFRREGFPAGNDPRVVAELRELRAEVVALRRENAAGHANTAGAVKTGDDRARVQRDDLARQGGDARRSRNG